MASMGFPDPLDSINTIRECAYAPATATLCSLIIFLWVLRRFSVKRKNTLGSRLPPGPFAWPIIGNLNQLKRLPHRDLHALTKKYGPIMMLKLGYVPTVVVSSSAMAKDMVLAPYGPYWRHMRKLYVVELLNAKRIESFSCVREEEMLLTVRSVWEISRQGSQSDAQVGGNGEEIKKLTVEAAVTVGAVNIGDFIPYLDWMDLQGVKRRLKKVHNSIAQVIKKIIEEHQQRRMKLHKEQNAATKGLIDVLLEMESLDGRAITQENIEAIVFDMFIAGVETTSTTLEWAMSEILRNPGVAKKMQEEIESVVGRERAVSERDIGSMEYVQCVVNETLRLYPALPLLLPVILL
ncbi:cytochrome P450 750A1-like [Cryptomeria japonica]|uniref:cytochrome P450 750A1-like n=1 Tax=Cryptomeria japonica TaxID=3369 RepID=UPI0027DA8389|nr:cytochrome P450 750A1-like [Cryptomeria japonica]